jgi:hypothetical protein
MVLLTPAHSSLSHYPPVSVSWITVTPVVTYLLLHLFAPLRGSEAEDSEEEDSEDDDNEEEDSEEDSRRTVRMRALRSAEWSWGGQREAGRGQRGGHTEDIE